MCESVCVKYFMAADYSSATTSSSYAWPSVVMVTSSCGCERTTTESAEPKGTRRGERNQNKTTLTFEVFSSDQVLLSDLNADRTFLVQTEGRPMILLTRL